MLLIATMWSTHCIVIIVVRLPSNPLKYVSMHQAARCAHSHRLFINMYDLNAIIALGTATATLVCKIFLHVRI